MELKQRLLAVLLMTQNFSANSAFVDPHEPINNLQWKQGAGDRVSLYTLLAQPDVSEETRKSCIKDLLEQLFAADPNYIFQNVEELFVNRVPKEALSGITTFATNIVTRSDIKKVHALERWTLIHIAAYFSAKKGQPNLEIINFLQEKIGIGLAIETKYDNWQPHNLSDSFVPDITVTPGDVIERFTQKGDPLRALFQFQCIS
ncbi:MAG: hypothetical protein EBU90_16490 [Proteobacteria bacterium]|nr:hypothetical protein [Pseudomonadota bacterium]NBP14355.1 hypothetical protein [bacterium]